MARTRRIAIASEYQQTREQRMMQNRDRFQKLGIVDLCLKLKPKRTPKPFKSPSFDPTQPRRRSSRLQNPPPVSKRRDIELEEGAKLEFYTEEHDGLAEDPEKPKRPPSSFFVFMEDFRVQYKQKHPDNKSVAAVGKAAAEKWKSMSDAEKAPYIEETEKRKVDYEKTMCAYKEKLGEGSEDERDESDKSRSSEVNDEDDDDDSGMAEGPQDERKDESDKSRSEVNDEDDDDDSGKEKVPCIQKVEKRKADYEKNMILLFRLAEDPEKPKREDFRVQYKQKHPDNKSVAAVGKAAAEKWKSMSDAEKAPYIEETEKRKVDYEKTMCAYKEKLGEGSEDERDESDKSRSSEVNDEDDDDDSGMAEGPQDERKDESDKSRSEVNDEDDDDDSGKEKVPCIQKVEKRKADYEKNMILLFRLAEDPEKPKRPPSSFFVFMEDFRVQYKQKHPDNKSVAAVGKAAAEKWKSMSDAEKAPYIEETEKRKVDYEKTMCAYKEKLGEGSEDERDESDKSRSSEVNDEDDDDDSGMAEGPQDERKDESDKSRSEVNDEDGDDDSGKEKVPCIQKVEKRKADYEKNMSAYKKRLAEGHGWLPLPPPFLETSTAALEYEQIREQRIKQNHERFKELGIVDLSLQLKTRRTPKPSNHRITPSLAPTQPRRRSFRLQNPPPAPKRSRDIVLEEGTKSEFYSQEHDGQCTAKMGMPAEDPNKPKKPLSSFFLFIEDFRVQYKQKHPDNKSIFAVGKAAGVEWRSMSDAEKAPYVEKAEKRKADCEKNRSAYKKRLAEGSKDEREDESDKSRSDIKDENGDNNSGKEVENDD